MICIRIEAPSGARFEHQLSPGIYILGREEGACDVPILSPEVSRRHAQVTLGGDQCTVEDLGSTSGTFHQDQRLEGPRSFPYPVELKLGTVRLSIRAQASGSDDDSLDTLAADGTIAENADAPVHAKSGQAATGHYTPGKEIARGGMGAVLEANDQLLGRTVAMKVIRLDLNDSESVRLRFIREATVLARLEHPNIVPIHEMGKDAAGHLFYTMKKVEGRTLQAILDDLKKGDPATVRDYSLDALLTIFRKVCDAMAFAHAKGVIHRDLKPENVMIGAYGEVLVMDWGLAKVLLDVGQTAQEIAQTQVAEDSPNPDTQLPTGFEELSDSQLSGSSQNLTMDGAVMGSPQYMPPEQAEGRVGEIDERSDIFSLGGILYSILTLHPPVAGRTVKEVLENVKSGNIVEPTRFHTAPSSPGARGSSGAVQEPAQIAALPHCPGGRIPAALSSVSMKALAFDPAARYADVGTLSGDIEFYQRGFATTAERAGWLTRARLFARRHRVIVLGVAGVLFVGGGLGGKALLDGRRASRALVDLQAAAPDLVRLAAADANSGNYKDAERNIAAARAINPDLTELYWQHTWNLIGQAQYAGAIVALKEALRRDPTRQERLAMLSHLEAFAGDDAAIERTDPGRALTLAEALQQAGALGPMGTVMKPFSDRAAERLARTRNALKAFLSPIQYELSSQSSGIISLILKAGSIKSLEEIRGLPVDALQVMECNIDSLEPLRGARLSHLRISSGPVSDLSPLEGMSLTGITFAKTGISDLGPLAGMPLKSFFGSGQITDLSPLRGAPLETVEIVSSPIADLEPLSEAPLQTVTIVGGNLKDLGPLSGKPIEYLRLDHLPIEDLAPLQGLPLKKLEISNNDLLQDLEPLRGLPVQHLVINHDPRITNFDALLDLPGLETVACVGTPKARPTLRQHPTLRTIIDQLDDDPKATARSVAEYWHRIDLKTKEPK